MLRRLGSALAAVLLALSLGAARLGDASASPPAGRAAVAQAVPAVTSVPTDCAPRRPWPEGENQALIVTELARNTGVRLTGPGWRDSAHLPMIRVVWQTLEGLSCTGYVQHIEKLNPGFTLNAAPISGWAWGDWGLTRSGAVTLDFAKWSRAIVDRDEGHMVRLLVHELAHAWATDRDSARYWSGYARLDARLGPISAYGGRAITENFSEMIGYYVARCAKHNPYDSARFRGYYDYVRTTVFGGREFGPAPGRTPDCSAPGNVRVVPTGVPSARSAPTPPRHDPTLGGLERLVLLGSDHRPT